MVAAVAISRIAAVVAVTVITAVTAAVAIAVVITKIAAAAAVVVITVVTAAAVALATSRIAAVFRSASRLARRRAAALRLLRFARRPVVVARSTVLLATALLRELRVMAPHKAFLLTRSARRQVVSKLAPKPVLLAPPLVLVQTSRQVKTTNFCLRGLLPRSLRLQDCRFPPVG